MTFILVTLGAGVAVSVELIEALAIVLAVGVSRRWSDALIGAAAAVCVCAVLAAVLGPVLLASVSLDTLRVTIGVLLLLFGCEWLRKGTLRLAGRRARASSLAEYAEAQAELEDEPLPSPGQPDWAGRLVAFKGVLLEGVEVVLIVSALAARPSGPAPALLGSACALVTILAAGAWLRRPVSRLPETELKWGVGVLLSAFGIFFVAEGLGVKWPLGDAAIIYVAATLGSVSQLQSHMLARQARTA
jgi:uncharacterized membrane protein